VDRVLFKDPGHPEKRLAGFLQAGYGDSRVDRFGSYLGAGLTAVALSQDATRTSWDSRSRTRTMAHTT
jgi:hypothetical protein